MTATTPVPVVATGRWVVDPERSSARFSVRNFGVRTVSGSVPVLAGSLEIDDGGCPRRVAAELDLSALDTGNARRDADLRKRSLLDLDTHPVLTYAADEFEVGPQGWSARGRLCARGTSCPVPVLGVPAGTDASLHLVGTAVLDRTALGIRAPRLLIGREVSVVVDAWLDRG
jgi:polyisoprenoid-binding protein YceI